MSELHPIARWLDPLREAIPATASGDSAAQEDAVHQVRVATRRLDTWLRIGGYRVLRDDLRWLRGAAAPVRDLDVMLRRSSDFEEQQALVSRREAALPALGATLSGPRTEALLLALSLLPPLPDREVKQGIRRFARQLLKRRANPASARDVHRRRRDLRRLRYAEELSGRPVEDLVKLQDVLGVVSDASIEAEESSSPALTEALREAEALWRQHTRGIEARA